jgi:hypothetical protein
MITLQAGVAPPVLKRLPAPDLEHLSVFSSRSREDGRDRYRLHVGYFDEEAIAQALLVRVRAWYPEAWVVAAGRYTVVARLPTLPVLISAPAPAEDLLGLYPLAACDLAPLPLSTVGPLADGEPQALAAKVSPALNATPALQSAHPVSPSLTLAPALPAADVLHTYKGDNASPRASLSVSDWTSSASTPKPKSKPTPTSWFKRLTALHP